MPTFALWIEYDGTAFHGWQRQPGQRTIQGCLEDAVRIIAHRRIAVTGAGRTDAGVHARAQVAHFHATGRMNASAWQRALNSELPSDIRITRAAAASDDFHARFSAHRKIYHYRVLNRPWRSPLRDRYVWTVFQPLRRAPMARAASMLAGRHDFSRLRASDPHEKNRRNPFCIVFRAKVYRRGDEWVFVFEADRFLHLMIRRIVGVLVEIGKGRWDRMVLERLLAGAESPAAPTAPAQGLCLEQVIYHQQFEA